jgi:hypothetical protein
MYDPFQGVHAPPVLRGVARPRGLMPQGARLRGSRGGIQALVTTNPLAVALSSTLLVDHIFFHVVITFPNGPCFPYCGDRSPPGHRMSDFSANHFPNKMAQHWFLLSLLHQCFAICLSYDHLLSRSEVWRTYGSLILYVHAKRLEVLNGSLASTPCMVRNTSLLGISTKVK